MTLINACTFFGHRDCPYHIRPILKDAIIDLIENHGVKQFFIGTHGAFDRLAISVLCELSEIYTGILCTVVLSYVPQKKEEYPFETLLPSGIESVPRRYAINFRNKWMLRNSSHVIFYITHNWSNTSKYADMAVRYNKMVIFLADQNPPTK